MAADASFLALEVTLNIIERASHNREVDGDDLNFKLRRLLRDIGLDLLFLRLDGGSVAVLIKCFLLGTV